MRSDAKTVEQYLAGLPDDRRKAIAALRGVILKNLPKGYEEGMAYGMIGYHVPHRIYPAGYHCNPSQPLPFASLASQKNHIALYLMCMYGDREFERWFREAWAKSGKKLDMGKSCIRFKRIEDVPLDVIGAAIRKIPPKKLIAFYEEAIKGGGGKRAAARRKPPAKKTKAAAKRGAAKTEPTARTRSSAKKKSSARSRASATRRPDA